MNNKKMACISIYDIFYIFFIYFPQLNGMYSKEKYFEQT